MSIRLYATVFVIVFSLTLIATAGVAALRLALVDGAGLAETARSQLAAATGRPVAMAGARLVRFTPGTAPALAIERLRLPAAGDRQAPLAILEDVRVRFAWADMLVAGTGPPRAITVGEARLNLAWRDSGPASWAPPASGPRPDAAEELPATTVATVESGTVRLSPAGQPGREIALRQARIAAGRPGLTGEALWRVLAELGSGDTPPMEVQLGLGAPDQLFSGVRGRFEAAVTGPDGRFQLFGTASNLDAGPAAADFDGELSLRGDNLARAWPWNRPPASSLPETGFRLTSRLAKTGRTVGLSELALRAGGAELLARGELVLPAPGGRTAALTGDVFVDGLDLAAMNGRWGAFWQGLAATRHELDLTVQAGKLWANALELAGESEATLRQTGDAPLTLRFTSDNAADFTPGPRRPAGAHHPDREAAKPTPAPPPASDTATRHWQDVLQPMRAGLAEPSCLAGAIRFRAGTGFLHAVLDSQDGRRIANGQVKRAGPDLTVKYRRQAAASAAANGGWHVGGSWARPRRTSVPTADGAGPAGGLAVPRGGDCAAGLGALLPAGD